MQTRITKHKEGLKNLGALADGSSHTALGLVKLTAQDAAVTGMSSNGQAALWVDFSNNIGADGACLLDLSLLAVDSEVLDIEASADEQVVQVTTDLGTTTITVPPTNQYPVLDRVVVLDGVTAKGLGPALKKAMQCLGGPKDSDRFKVVHIVANGANVVVNGADQHSLYQTVLPLDKPTDGKVFLDKTSASALVQLEDPALEFGNRSLAAVWRDYTLTTVSALVAHVPNIPVISPGVPLFDGPSPDIKKALDAAKRVDDLVTLTNENGALGIAAGRAGKSFKGTVQVDAMHADFKVIVRIDQFSKALKLIGLANFSMVDLASPALCVTSGTEAYLMAIHQEV